MGSSTRPNDPVSPDDITYKIPAGLKPGDEFTFMGMRAVISSEVEPGTFEIHLGSEKLVYRFEQEKS